MDSLSSDAHGAIGDYDRVGALYKKLLERELRKNHVQI
jgi:hypothetical protein